MVPHPNYSANATISFLSDPTSAWISSRISGGQSLKVTDNNGGGGCESRKDPVTSLNIALTGEGVEVLKKHLGAMVARRMDF